MDNRPLWQRQRDALRAEAEAAADPDDLEDLFAALDQVEQDTLDDLTKYRAPYPVRHYRGGSGGTHVEIRGTQPPELQIKAFQVARAAPEPMYCAPWPAVAITKYLPPDVQYEVRMVLNLRTLADDLHELEAIFDTCKAELLRALAGLQHP